MDTSSPIQYQLNLGLAPQPFRINGAFAGAQQIVIACASYPSAGTLSLEYQLAGDTTWRPVPKGTNLPFLGPIVLATYGPVAGYRVNLSGIVGGSGPAAWVAQADPEGFPPGAFVGLRALTTQSYIEANVKNGVQFEASALNEGVLAGANIDVAFTTGAKPVLIKLRKVDYNGVKMQARVFRNTVYTVGAGVAVPVYNMNLRNPVASTIQAYVGASISNIGIEAGAPTFGIGSTGGVGQSTLGSYATSGIERLLAPNSNYALRITNTSNATQDIATYISWYEGDTDLPT